MNWYLKYFETLKDFNKILSDEVDKHSTTYENSYKIYQIVFQELINSGIRYTIDNELAVIETDGFRYTIDKNHIKEVDKYNIDESYSINADNRSVKPLYMYDDETEIDLDKEELSYEDIKRKEENDKYLKSIKDGYNEDEYVDSNNDVKLLEENVNDTSDLDESENIEEELDFEEEGDEDDIEEHIKIEEDEPTFEDPNPQEPQFEEPTFEEPSSLSDSEIQDDSLSLNIVMDDEFSQEDHKEADFGNEEVDPSKYELPIEDEDEDSNPFNPPDLPTTMNKNDFTHTAISGKVIFTQTGEKKKISMLVIPERIEEENPEIIACVIADGEKKTYVSGKDKNILFEEFGVSFMITGKVNEDGDYDVIVEALNDGVELKLKQNKSGGKKGHIAAIDMENEVVVHLIPLAFDNNLDSGLTTFLYYIDHKDEYLVDENSDGAPVLFNLNDQTLELKAKWRDETMVCAIMKAK